MGHMHVEMQLHSRQRLLWAVYTAVVSEGRLLFGSACVPSGVYVTLAAASVVCLESWCAEIRLIIRESSSVFAFPSMVFLAVVHTHREHRVHLFSSPVIAVFCCANKP